MAPFLLNFARAPKPRFVPGILISSKKSGIHRELGILWAAASFGEEERRGNGCSQPSRGAPRHPSVRPRSSVMRLGIRCCGKPGNRRLLLEPSQTRQNPAGTWYSAHAEELGKPRQSAVVLRKKGGKHIQGFNFQIPLSSSQRLVFFPQTCWLSLLLLEWSQL